MLGARVRTRIREARDRLPGGLLRQATRFGLGGIANTCLGLALYEMLLFVVSYRSAYTLSFVEGLAFASVFNIRFVFAAPMTLRSVGAIVALYLAQYAVGLGLTILLVEQLGLHPRFAPFVLLLVLPPFSFFGARLLLARLNGGVHHR